MPRPRLTFDWSLIRSFLAVLDAGSLLAAARVLHMHQPTLSRHIAQLESQLGTPLFERTGRGLVPTQAARAMAIGARQMQVAASFMADSLARSADAEQGTVRITTSEVAAVHLLPPILADLRQLAPNIQIELEASDQVSNLLVRDADIAVRMVRPTQAGLRARKVAEIKVGLYAHERYLQTHGHPSTADALAQHTLIGFDRSLDIIQGFARAGMRLTPADFALRTDHQLSHIELVAAGAGLGFVAHYTVRDRAGLQQVLPDIPLPTLPCWLIVHREIQARRTVRIVYDHLARGIAQRLGAE